MGDRRTREGGTVGMTDAGSQTQVTSAADLLGGQDAPRTEQQPTTDDQTKWYGQIDSELAGYADNKGWKTAQDALTGYRNLEKLLGADRAGNTLVRPKDDDAEAWKEFFGKIGRPDNKDGYDIQGDGDFVEWFKSEALETGLTKAQANRLYESFNEAALAKQETQQQQSEAEKQADVAALKKDYGLAYDANMKIAAKAAKRFGFDQDSIDKMESVIGTKSVLEKFVQIGKAMGEHAFEGGDDNSSFAMSPGQAKSKINELLADKNFKESYLKGDQHALDKMEALHEAAYVG